MTAVISRACSSSPAMNWRATTESPRSSVGVEEGVLPVGEEREVGVHPRALHALRAALA